MLRNFIHILKPNEIEEVFDQFLFEIENKDTVLLLQYKILTPDAFVWKLIIDKGIYYLYAEDHVESIKQVLNNVLSVAPSGVSLNPIPARNAQAFTSASPVTNAAIYQEPKDSHEMMKYAVPSGYDFVFLCKSTEEVTNAFLTIKAWQ